MAVAWRPRVRPILSFAIIAAIVGSVVAKSVAQLSVPEIEDAIQVGLHPPGTPDCELPGSHERQRLTARRDVR